MEHFVGLDVSQDTTHLCVVDSNGGIVWQGKCDSTPEDIAKSIKARAPLVARIGLESGALSTWHWHALNAVGLPVVCLDARHAKAALNMQVNKTDRNDAYGLAQIVRKGWYRKVEVKTLDSHTVRAMLRTRGRLVAMRTEIINQLRGVLKTFGVVIRKRSGRTFEQRVEEAVREEGMLKDTIGVLLATLRHLTEQVHALDKKTNKYTKESKVCRHLMTVPGVGKLTAAAFVTAVDDPARFQNSRTVGAYFGLTPRRYQSGELDLGGRISKCGDSLVRAYLFEAATVLLTRVPRWSPLKAWGLKIAKRNGMKKAQVAVARKLAVIMHQMWLTGEEFRWSNGEAATA
jgi:transposase